MLKFKCLYSVRELGWFVTSQEKDIVVVGDSALAEIVYECLKYESSRNVVAFSIEEAFMKRSELFGLPVVPFESLVEDYPPNKYAVSVAIGYNQLNKVRERLYQESKRRGYETVGFQSSSSSVWRNAKVGENCFLFENVLVQPFSKVGNNVVARAAAVIGHHTVLGDNLYIAGHAIVGGYTEIGNNCFLGLNCTIANNLRIAEHCVIGAGAVITRDTEAGRVYKAQPATLSHRNSDQIFG